MIKKISEYFLLQIFIFTAICSTPLISNADDNQTHRKQQIFDVEEKSKKLKNNSYSWLRDPRLQKVFNTTSKKLNIFHFLSPKQKELFKKNSSEVDKEFEAKQQAEKNSDFKLNSTIAEVTRTYLLMYALSIVAIIKEDSMKFYITGNLSSADTGKKILEAITEIVNSGEILSAMIGAGVTHKTLSKPLQFLQYLSQDAKVAPFFKSFMIHFTHTLVSFSGWEFGTQLWKEATNLLDIQRQDEKEREFLKDRNKVFTLIFRALTPASLATNPQKGKIARIFLQQTVENIIKIIFVDSDMRLQWIYNSIRLRIANGNFVSLVTSMATASAIGTTLFPMAGTMLGLTFGFAGGVATIIIPEENKNQITVAIKNKWISALDKFKGSSSAASFVMGFKDDLTSVMNSKVTLDDVILDRTNYRESLVDIYIERIYYDNNQMIHTNETLKKHYEELRKNTNNVRLTDEIKSLKLKNFENYSSILKSLNELVSLYLSEAQFFEKKKNNSSEILTDKFASQVINSENILTHFCTFSQSLLNLDYLDIKSKFLSQNSDLDKLQGICKFKLSGEYRYYESMPVVLKDDYDSAIRFLDKTYWSKFNEIATSSERLDEIFLLNNL
jgi:hypothetical protein